MMGQDWWKTFARVKGARVNVAGAEGMAEVYGLGDVRRSLKIDVVQPEGGMDFCWVRPRLWLWSVWGQSGH